MHAPACRATRGAQFPGRRPGLRGGNLPPVIGGEQLMLGGDIILAVEGIELAKPDSYEAIRRRLLTARAEDSPVHLTVFRQGVAVELSGVAQR
jgi:hypothetical protein